MCEALGDGGPRESEFDEEQTTLIVRKALSGVARIHRMYGLTAAVKLLAGIDDPRLQRAGLDQLKTFGILQEHAEAWIKKLLHRCVAAGWVEYTPGDRPLALLSAGGFDEYLPLGEGDLSLQVRAMISSRARTHAVFLRVTTRPGVVQRKWCGVCAPLLPR